ncbi:MAG: hypothetical protein K2X07_00935 [Caulobacteraceae bacterium]|nr:hypothetical protein [Caulobacteraceae bacterium]
MSPSKPLLAVLAAFALAACGSESAPAPAAAPTAQAWRAAPRVETAVRTTGMLELTGVAEPGARVVMRDAGGTAHAATADAQGAFSLRLDPGAGDVLLRPQDQEGQDALPGPDQIVVLADGRALALSPGAPSRRLDPGAGLAAIDSDGRMALVSGRRARGAADARVRIGAGDEMAVAADARGVWTLRGDAASVAQGVWVDGVEHRPVLSGAVPGTARATGSGTLIGWMAPDGALIATWAPAR